MAGLIRSLTNALNKETAGAAVGTQYGGEYQNVSYTDLISEGPIWGLVDGAASVYFDDNPGEEGKYAAYKPKRVTAEVTFNGSSTTGTFDDDVNFDASFRIGQGRELVTVPHKRFTVTITSKSSSDSGMTFGLQTNGSTPSPFNFSSSVFETTSSSTFSRVVALTVLFSTGTVKRFSFQGTLSVIDSANASMEVALNSLSKGMYDNIVVNTTIAYITVIENREITDINRTTRQVTVSGSAPPAQSSIFWITDSHTFNSAVATGVNVDTTINRLSHVGKIDDLYVQETFGTVDQYALPRIQNVGGSVATIGPANNAQQIRMFDYREMGNIPANHVGLVTQPIEPQHLDEQRGEPIDYDDTEKFSVDFGPSDFGLSGVQIDLADTIQFDILYGSGLIYFGGNGSPNYYYMTAMYNVILELYTGNGILRNTINLFPEGLIHRGRRQGPLIFTHEIDLQQFRNLYGPFTSFQLHLYRYTRHKGATMKADGTRANKDTKYWQVLALAQVTNLGATFQDKLTYPNSALINTVFSSRQFKTAPKRSFDVKGRLIKVPSTYTPREYSDTGLAKYQGFWDGTFIDSVYTDNPAWIFYDLITNERYGAGTWIDSSVVDKYALYRISKYCDELVPASEEINASIFTEDEFWEIRTIGSQADWNQMARTSNVTYAVGDMVRVLEPGPSSTSATGVRYEPRFRMNLYLTKAEAVYKVIKDVASAFTSILYWMDGHLTLLQDAPANSVHTFTKSNVIGGKFSYQTTPAKLRPNQFIVYYNDPKTNYALAPVMYEDPVAIVKQGKVINKSANAFGCTSESQAIRYAKWKLWTAQNQKEIVIFQTGLQGNFVRPGDIIGVQDASRQNVTYSGRVSTSTLTTMTFDRQVRFNGNSTYYLNVMFSKPAAIYVGYDPVTVNGTTYSKGDYIPEAYIRTSGGAYVLSNLDTEEKASNAFKDTSSEDLLSIVWKKYTHVRQYPIDNPATAGTFLHEDVVTLSTGEVFEENVADGTVWSLFETAASGETVLGSEKLYKVLTVAQDEKNIYTIQAVEHSNAKFDAVDTDYELGNIPPSIYPEVEPEEVPPPLNLRIKPFSDNVAQLFEEFQLQWDPPDTIYIAAYEVSASPNIFEDEVTVKLVGDTSITFKDVPQGKYSFRVRTVSPKRNVSEWVTFVLDYGEALDEDGNPIGVVDDSIERIHGLPVWAHSNTDGRIKSESGTAASTTEYYQVTNRYGGNLSFAGMPNSFSLVAGDYYVLEIVTSAATNNWVSQTWVWNGVKIGSRWNATTALTDTYIVNGETYEKGSLQEGPTNYTISGLSSTYKVFSLKGETMQGQEGFEVWTFDSFDAELASYGSPSSYATITEASGNGVVDLSGIPDGDDRELYIVFDHSVPKIFLGYYDTDLHPVAGGIWRDIGDGTGSMNLTYTAITGSASIGANSTTLTGTSTLFTTEVRVGDFISLSNATSAGAIPNPSSAVKVLAINSDTEILIDAAFEDAISVTNLYRSSYRPDYAKDAVIAFVERE